MPALLVILDGGAGAGEGVPVAAPARVVADAAHAVGAVEAALRAA